MTDNQSREKSSGESRSQEIDLSSNYYLQHRNSILFSLITIIIIVTKAKLNLKDFMYMDDSAPGISALKFSFLAWLGAVYSTIYLILEWVRQALPQFRQANSSIDHISSNFVSLTRSVRESASRLEGEVREWSKLAKFRSSGFDPKLAAEPDEKFSQEMQRIHRLIAILSEKTGESTTNNYPNSDSKFERNHHRYDEINSFYVELREAGRNLYKAFLDKASYHHDSFEIEIERLNSKIESIRSIVVQIEGLRLPAEARRSLTFVRMVNLSWTYIVGIFIPVFLFLIATLGIIHPRLLAWLEPVIST